MCVTYNQEAYIEQALTSLFKGNVWPDELIVLDDCSTDGTRAVVERVIGRLKLEYPCHFRTMFNPVNLGVYGNLNQMIGLPTCDVVHVIAGDDWEEPGMFERMNQEIRLRGLDPRSESFILMPNSYIYNGREMQLVSNSGKKIQPLFKSALRHAVWNMLVGMSSAYFRQFPKYNSDLGIWADYHHALNFARHCDQVYILDEAYPVYRSGVGISSRTSATDQSSSYLKALKQIEIDFDSELDRSDRRYLKYVRLLHTENERRNLLFLAEFCWSYLTNLSNGAKRHDIKGGVSRYLRQHVLLTNLLVKLGVLKARG